MTSRRTSVFIARHRWGGLSRGLVSRSSGGGRAWASRGCRVWPFRPWPRRSAGGRGGGGPAGEAAFGHFAHGHVDRQADDAVLPVDPAVGVELLLLLGEEALEV